MGDFEAIHVSTAWFPLTKLIQLLPLPNVQSVRNREQCLIWPYPLRSPTSHLVVIWLHGYQGSNLFYLEKIIFQGLPFLPAEPQMAPPSAPEGLEHPLTGIPHHILSHQGIYLMRMEVHQRAHGNRISLPLSYKTT